jgi:hypothetical protein
MMPPSGRFAMIGWAHGVDVHCASGFVFSPTCLLASDMALRALLEGHRFGLSESRGPFL